MLPLAAVTPFATVPVARSEADEPVLELGVRGEWSGWLLLRTRAAEAPGSKPLAGAPPTDTAAAGPGLRVYGLPLTTCALWRFGQALLPAASAAAGAGGAPATSQPAGNDTCAGSP